MPVDGIPESKPIGDGQPGREGWSSSGGRRDRGEGQKPLIRGKDQVQFHSKKEQALAVLRHSILNGIQEALGLEARPMAYGQETCWTSAKIAEQLLSLAGQALQEALAKGISDAPERLRQGASRGIEEALEVLGGELEGEAGEVVTQTLALWAEGLQRVE